MAVSFLKLASDTSKSPTTAAKPPIPTIYRNNTETQLFGNILILSGQFFGTISSCYIGGMWHLLRKVASIVCLVLCVALMGLWVRSYWWLDSLNFRIFTHSFALASDGGRISLEVSSGAIGLWRWEWLSQRVLSHLWAARGELGFYFETDQLSTILYLPHWFVILVTACLAMLIRIRVSLRFDLRSLFIATTFLAVVLGMIGVAGPGVDREVRCRHVCRIICVNGFTPIPS